MVMFRVSRILALNSFNRTHRKVNIVMIKLIASDLDGTLLREGAQRLNPEIYDIVRALKRKGILFVSASGRQLNSQQNLFLPIAGEISYIAENGAVCVHQNEVISTFDIERNLCFRIIDAIAEKPHCMTIISTPSSCYLKSGNDEFADFMRNVVKNKITVVEDFSVITEPILKLACLTSGDVTEDIDDLRSQFESEIKVMTAGPAWIDFMPYDTNKGTALKILLEKLGIRPEEVLAFGDQENDVEMLELAGTSYAMDTAKLTVQKCADYITDSVENVLRKLLE